MSPASAPSPLIEAILFYALAGVAAASAVTLVVSRNIVRSAVCLLFTLASVAGLYFLLDAQFLAAVQLVVYAGGTLILIVFGVMLTAQSPFARWRPGRGETMAAVGVGGLMTAVLVLAIASADFPQTAGPTGEVTLLQLGRALLGEDVVPFEVISVLLLVVLIGAAYLAKVRPQLATPDPEDRDEHPPIIEPPPLPLLPPANDALAVTPADLQDFPEATSFDAPLAETPASQIT